MCFDVGAKEAWELNNSNKSWDVPATLMSIWGRSICGHLTAAFVSFCGHHKHFKKYGGQDLSRPRHASGRHTKIYQAVRNKTELSWTQTKKNTALEWFGVISEMTITIRGAWSIPDRACPPDFTRLLDSWPPTPSGRFSALTASQHFEDVDGACRQRWIDWLSMYVHIELLLDLYGSITGQAIEATARQLTAHHLEAFWPKSTSPPAQLRHHLDRWVCIGLACR